MAVAAEGRWGGREALAALGEGLVEAVVMLPRGASLPNRVVRFRGEILEILRLGFFCFDVLQFFL